MFHIKQAFSLLKVGQVTKNQNKMQKLNQWFKMNQNTIVAFHTHEGIGVHW